MSSDRITRDMVARLIAHDGSLYSNDPAIAAEAASFMGWTHLARDAAEVLPTILRLADEVRAEGLTDVVLLGMGGSSLAGLVMNEILAPGKPRVHILDTTAPVTVTRTLEETDAATTLFLLSSKSGGTIEPNALYAIFRADADTALGREAAGRRFIAVTDPGSTLERLAMTDGMRACVLTPSEVGGRYSALTAFGLLPAALAGIDVRCLVERALMVERGYEESTGDTSLAESIASAHAQGADKLLIGAPPALRVFGVWVEQLIAESLGKQGMGVVPVVSYGEHFREREVSFTLSRTGREVDAVGEPQRMPLADPYDLGGWFVHWEYSTALAGVLIGVNPFDQPNVAEAKDATAAVLAGQLAPTLPALSVDGVEFTFGGGMHEPEHPERSLAAVLTHVVQSLRPADYLAVLAYLPNDQALFDPLADAVAAVTAATGVATCLEVGPRYLHSTGQLHKGGPDTGVFVMVTTRDETDLAVPGREWSLRDLYCAQAEGDFATLTAHGRPVLRVSLNDASSDSARSFAAALRQAASEGGERAGG